MELESNLGADIPPQRRADHSRSEVVVSSIRVSEHDSEVFGDIIQHDQEGMFGFDIRFGVQDAVVEEFFVLGQ